MTAEHELQGASSVEGGSEKEPGAKPGLTRLWRRIPESIRVSSPLLAAILALGAYSSVASEFFLTQRNLENIAQQISVLGVITVGMTLLMVAGLMDLSVGALASFITVIAARLSVGGQSTAVIVIVALAVGVTAGLATGWIVAAARVAPFILTLGGLSVFVSLGLILSKSQPIPVDADLFAEFGSGKWVGIPASAVVFIAALVLGAGILRYTSLGRDAFAMGSNPQAAFLAGVPIARVTMGLFAISGLLVGTAAIILLGRVGAGDPNVGTGLELQAIAAVVLGGASLAGGRGSVWGSFLGVVLLGVIANSLALLGVEVAYQQLVYGGVLIIAVVANSLREQGGWRVLTRALSRSLPREGEN